jgi:ATP/ADP translocase
MPGERCLFFFLLIFYSGRKEKGVISFFPSAAAAAAAAVGIVENIKARVSSLACLNSQKGRPTTTTDDATVR